MIMYQSVLKIAEVIDTFAAIRAANNQVHQQQQQQLQQSNINEKQGFHPNLEQQQHVSLSHEPAPPPYEILQHTNQSAPNLPMTGYGQATAPPYLPPCQNAPMMYPPNTNIPITYALNQNTNNLNTNNAVPVSYVQNNQATPPTINETNNTNSTATTSTQQQQQQPQQPSIISSQPSIASSQPQTVNVLIAGCPNCHKGVLVNTYWTCPGICCCVLFFPIGLCCLFLCKKKRCTNCGEKF